MHTIEQVLDVDKMRAEIADLGTQVAAPDLWDDQANAQRVTGRLSALQGHLDRFTSLQQRLDDLSLMIEMAREESRPVTLVALAWSSHRSGAATWTPSSAISLRIASRSSTCSMVLMVARSCLISVS